MEPPSTFNSGRDIAEFGRAIGLTCGISPSIDAHDIVESVTSGKIELRDCWMNRDVAECKEPDFEKGGQSNPYSDCLRNKGSEVAAARLDRVNFFKSEGSRAPGLPSGVSKQYPRPPRGPGPIQGAATTLRIAPEVLEAGCHQWYRDFQDAPDTFALPVVVGDAVDAQYETGTPKFNSHQPYYMPESNSCQTLAPPYSVAGQTRRPIFNYKKERIEYCERSVCGFEAADYWTPSQAHMTICLFPAVETNFYTCSRDRYNRARANALAGMSSSDDWAESWNLALECQKETGLTQNDPSPTLKPDSCYKGLLGSAAIKVLGARQDVELARKQWKDAEEIYEVQVRLCNSLDEDTNIVKQLDASFRGEMDAWRKARTAAAVFSGFVNGLATGMMTGNAGPAVAGGMVALISSGIENQMDAAREAHDAQLRAIAQKQQVRQCYAEAEKIRVTFVTHRAVMERRATDAVAARQEFDRMKSETERSYRDGVAALGREAGRKFPTYAHSYWYEEKAERYQREFDWAKRLVYLSMRAVEYEFQQTLGLRSPIMLASHPDQLEAALRELQREVATRAINRRRPEEASAVLSLRDDVLGVRGRDDEGPGERNWPASTIFRGRLWDSRFAVRDDTGRWMGQGIPFTLTPRGVLFNRCGERLWRVTATVQGDGLSTVQPGVPLVLLKRNTFFSQWCSGHGDGRDHQMGQLQPSVNLFRATDGKPPVRPEQETYSAASLYPWFNVRRNDFYNVQFRNGASEELAGRGLYGDHILLFPRELLEGDSTPVKGSPLATGGSARSTPFPLDRVEDVLLRIDYLSVDNLPLVGK